MKIKAVRSFRHGTMTVGRGVALELPDADAKELIKRGFALEEGAQPEKSERPALSDRPKHKPGKTGNQRRDEVSATSGQAADRKED